MVCVVPNPTGKVGQPTDGEELGALSKHWLSLQVDAWGWAVISSPLQRAPGLEPCYAWGRGIRGWGRWRPHRRPHVTLLQADPLPLLAQNHANEDYIFFRIGPGHMTHSRCSVGRWPTILVLMSFKNEKEKVNFEVKEVSVCYVV